MTDIPAFKSVEEAKLYKLQLLQSKQRILENANLEGSFKQFVIAAWPNVEPGRPLKWNWHLDVICEHLEMCSRSEISHLIINVPPRSMKSWLVNVFYPVWVWISKPEHQFNNYSHNVRLATRDSLRGRRLISSDWFQERWGHRFKITSDQNQKTYYETESGGHRVAFGILSGITGAGADTQIIDDPHDAKGAQSDADRENVLEVIDDTLTSRFNDPATGVFIVIMQRLHEMDASGHLLRKWKGRVVHLCFPMEYDPGHKNVCVQDIRTTPGELLWEERFPQEIVDGYREDMTPYAFSGQYQQTPTPGDGGILPKNWWREWGKEERLKGREAALPVCDYVVQCWDTAYEEREQSDYTACTTWGVFKHEEEDRWAVILLHRFKQQIGFPDLRKKARELYTEWEPDTVLIEPKATGKSLIQELRRFNVPAQEWKPERSKQTGREVDKTARTHAAAIVLYDGAVFYVKRNWAQEVIDECAAFPLGENDDLVDTCTMAWLWLRRGWRIELKDDPEDDEPESKSSVEAAY